MRLDRNTNPDGKGKYAVVKLRPAAGLNAQGCINLLERAGLLSFGTKPGEEFFVLKLTDKYAGWALKAYAQAAVNDGEHEYGADVMALAEKADTELRKKPD
jgi:hypothetical protein